MAFWKKNSNEVAFVEGKKHWTDVIKNTGAPNLLMWKQPEEDFNTNSTLIVMPGESALFVHNGRIEQEFTEGTYKLSTENYPFISRLRNQFSGGISTFNCVVYYVRKAHSREIPWGIAPAIQLRDPVYQIMCKIRTNGAYKISIADSAKFLMYMIGSNKTAVSEDELQDYFGSQMQMHIKTLITQFINNSHAEVLGICQYMMEIAILISPFIAKAIEQYGMNLENFSIASMDIPDDDPHRDTLETAFSQHASMKVLGEDWARMQAAEILKTLAANPGAGGVASMGAGMGMGMAAAPIFANLSQQMFGQITAAPSQPTPAPLPSFGTGFGATSNTVPVNQPANPFSANSQPVMQNTQTAPSAFPGMTQQTAQPEQPVNPFAAAPSAPVQAAPNSMSDWQQSMNKLKFLHDNGMITEDVYQQKLNEIMSRM